MHVSSLAWQYISQCLVDILQVAMHTLGAFHTWGAAKNKVQALSAFSP